MDQVEIRITNHAFVRLAGRDRENRFRARAKMAPNCVILLVRLLVRVSQTPTVAAPGYRGE
jgi:hypothetical protein